MTAALLLPLDAADGYLLVDALVFLAEGIEKIDPDMAKDADRLAARIRLLRPLFAAEIEEVMKGVGLGRYRDHPQG